jgi:biopolymer transport protein ExbD
MRRLIGGGGDQSKDIDISPLIDVVFILLIFFMVSTTFVKDAQLDLERPSAQSAEKSNAESIRVSIDRHGTIFIGDMPVRSWMLQGRLRDLMRSGASKDILVSTDRSVAADLLIEVVDQCRMAGADHVGVVTDREMTAMQGGQG